MTISDTLTETNKQIVLEQLRIDWKSKNPDKDGWITIQSPLREDNNPSFGLNIDTGAYKDHGTGESGDIVTLVQQVCDVSNDEAIRWIKQQINYNWRESSSTKTQNTKLKKSRETFWTSERLLKLTEAQERLQEHPEHKVVTQATDYDQLTTETLNYYGCGIMEAYGQDWLAFPYETGCQLYQRKNNKKEIRALRGSRPGDSFFGTRKVSGETSALFIAKSPREAMLLYQNQSTADVIGLATGEQGKLSPKQYEWFEQQLVQSSYKKVFLFLDCDTAVAYQTTLQLANVIKEIAQDKEVSLINIHNITEGEHKDFTDLVQIESNGPVLSKLYKSRDIVSEHEIANDTKRLLPVIPEDLRLSEGLKGQLPEVVQKYLEYASPLSDVPDEFLLMPFIAIAGAAIGKSRYLKVGGLKFYPTIWTVLFAGSSTLRKSTAISLAKKPFKPIMEQYQQEYEQELRQWQEDKEFAEENEESFDVPEPKKRTLYCPDGFSDLTFWETLRDNGSIVSTPSEFTALWDELNKPRNSLGDIVLNMFDAEDSIRRTTRNAGDIELNNPVWCITGATTLSNFRQALTSTERGSGLLQRILPVCMQERTKQFKAPTELPNPDTELYRQITEVTERLIGLETQSVSISDEAKELHKEWCHHIHDQEGQLAERLPDIGGFISRLMIYALKIALIFQQLDYPNRPISVKKVKASIAVCEWLFKHIVYMMNRNYIFDSEYADRIAIRERIEEQTGQRITRTKLMNLSNFSKARLDKAIESEKDAGQIKEIKFDTAGRPRFEYERTHAT